LKLPMTQALAALERLDTIETVEDLDLQDMFGDLRTELEESFRNAVDRRAFVFQNKEQLLSLATSMREAWQRRERAIKNMIERLKEDTLAIMETHQGRAYEGDQFKLRLQRSPPRLNCGVTLTTQSFTNLISEFDIRPELQPFVTTFHVYKLDTDKIKSLLMSGQEIPGCTLTQDNHVRAGLK
jgi:hypothetical protein